LILSINKLLDKIIHTMMKVRKGHDSRTVQEIIGHSNHNTTVSYTHYANR